MFQSTLVYIFCFSFILVNARNAFIMDDRYVCSVKTSCIECLKLSQCSWCPTESKCFSKKLPKFAEFCSNDTIDHVDYGMNIEDNADCSCNKGEVEQRCYPPGVNEGPECSNRGTCVCGQCICNPNLDPQNPTKMVMGEYCEYDNFSCDDPKCNEGPYSLSHPSGENGYYKTTEVEIPLS